jgi:fructokinase
MQKRQIISIGEILYDIFPGYKRIGGAPFNFAYHLLKLGMPVYLLTKIGTDLPGRDILNLLEVNGFDTRHIQQTSLYKTGQVMVSLDTHGNPSFDILKDMAYDYIDFDSNLMSTLGQKPDLIYFGTLAQRTEKGHKAIQRILSARLQGTHCLYDINLRPDCFHEKIIRASLRQSDVVKMNMEELVLIKSLLDLSTSNNAAVEYLMAHYGIKMISLTKGKEGSELFTPSGSHQIKKDPIEVTGDTVGAGDAYASILALGYLNNWPPDQILKMATELAERVCALKGAIPKATAFYDGIIS